MDADVNIDVQTINQSNIVTILNDILHQSQQTNREVATMKNEISAMKSEMSTMKSEMSTMKSEISKMKNQLSKVK